MKQTFLILTAIAIPWASSAQDQSIASTLEVYVFPSDGQDSSQQSKDESACYEWAVSNTGSDPFAVKKEQQANEQQAQGDQQAASQVGQGAGAAGAVKGAVAGALIGEISHGDTSESAAIGAAVGAIHHRRRARHARAQAEQQASATAQQNEELTSEQLGNFNKAFSACLEGKKYTVKY